MNILSCFLGSVQLQLLLVLVSKFSRHSVSYNVNFLRLLTLADIVAFEDIEDL